MERLNLLLLTDSYKFSHYKQYPPKTQHVYSYFESRGGKYPETVFFGLQYLLMGYLRGVVVTPEGIDAADAFVSKHVGPGVFNRAGWDYILKVHGGKLPVRIKAVPEGSVVPVSNVLMTIENTDPACYWLTNYLETLLVQTWYPSTVATQSREIKKNILKYLQLTGDPKGIDFKLHDFGFRGVSSTESAALGGAAHLLNFMGTDTVIGIMLAQDYYKAGMVGFSIPAAEHSTMTAWGQDGEVDAMRNMLTQYPTGLVACVSDSYDIFRACSEIWGEKLKDRVLAREGCLVVRPDSGDPSSVVSLVLQILGDKLGATLNDKGYKVLNPHVRVIQGDGVCEEEINRILSRMKYEGWSADNIAFGMGGALLQKLHRDTQKFAFKCSSVTVDSQEREVYKDPVTDIGKVSKRGKLALLNIQGNYSTVKQTEVANYPQMTDQLVTVFENGEVIRKWTFEECRGKAALTT